MEGYKPFLGIQMLCARPWSDRGMSERFHYPLPIPPPFAREATARDTLFPPTPSLRCSDTEKLWDSKLQPLYCCLYSPSLSPTDTFDVIREKEVRLQLLATISGLYIDVTAWLLRQAILLKMQLISPSSFIGWICSSGSQPFLLPHGPLVVLMGGAGGVARWGSRAQTGGGRLYPAIPSPGLQATKGWHLATVHNIFKCTWSLAHWLQVFGTSYFGVTVPCASWCRDLFFFTNSDPLPSQSSNNQITQNKRHS